MSTKSKGFFKKLLGTVLSATCLLSGTAVAGTIATTSATLPVAAASSSDAPVFSWDNATVYFLLTDRFCNGDTSNDNAYGRMSTVAGDNRATFHGGDFAGITKKINEGYFTDLGVNAIWLTAPYEQLHGYILGDNFAHYSYHGYYVTDYTEPDAAYGTKAEFEKMVDTAHEKGIRIIMDIVMNHAGYNNMIDMNEYNYGTLLDGWKSVYDAGNLSQYHSYIDYTSSAADWGRWWGSDWVRSGLPGYSEDGDGSALTQCLTGLPDFRTESTKSVGIPQFLQTKWEKEGTLSTKLAKYGSSNTVTGYISTWLAEWVENYGIDGFRCDTAKHVEFASWNKLKQAGVAALKKWRQNNPSKPGANWTDDFWMTGECWDHGSYKDGYFTEGGFDSMINFETTGAGLLTADKIAGVYADYAGKINSDPSFNLLSYVSSHDSTLARPSDMYYLGSALLMLPGGVQIYYGDETARPLVSGVPNDGNGGAGHSLRSDMPWDNLNTDLVNHWGIVGRFRNNHLSVGAGDNVALTASSGVGFGRTYSKNGVEDKIAAVIAASANTSVTLDVSAIWSDGTMLTNFYDDSSATVSGGKITFNSGAHGTILIAEPDGSKGVVKVTHINQDTGATLKEETLSGMVGDSYTAQPLSTEGFTVAKVTGSKTGTFSETPASVTFYYTFDTSNYAYIEVKYVDAASGAEVAKGETTAAKIGSTYSVSPVDVKDYEVDLTKTTNASGTVKSGTNTVTFYYNYVEPTNLRVHYYNANGWSTVRIYAYDESGAAVKEFTGAWASATAMTAEGDGWFFAEVPDTESATVIFHNGAGAQEPSGVGTPGYNCSGEVWLKNGKQITAGKVNVVYSSTDGKVLGTEKLSGLSGESYTTSAKTFTGYTISTTPANASGTFTDGTVTVTYVYTPDNPVEELSNTSKVSATSVAVGSSVTITCSATGGTPAYSYKVDYKKTTDSSYTSLQAYSTTASVKFTPSAAATYTVRVTVKDSAGATEAKEFTVTATSTTTALTNKSTLSATSITLGKSVTVTGAASGGTSPYYYAVYYKKSASTSYTTAQAYSTTKTVTITPGAATTYDVRVKVKDKAGTIKTKDFTVKVTAAALSNTSTISATSVPAGSSVTITGKASGGTSPYQYAAYYKKASSTSYTTVRGYSTTAKMTFTPSVATTYDVRVKVRDNVGTVVAKDFTVKATAAALSNSSTVSATSVTFGKSVTITGKASGGTSPYQYAAYYKKASTTTYTKLRDYKTTATMTFTPAVATTYDLRVKVKDNAGTVKNKDFTIKVTAAALANASTLSATSVTLGKSVTITGKATGGASPYRYAAYYKKSSSSSYTTIQGYSTTSKMTFTPGVATTYDVRVKVKDNAGTIKTKDFTVKVTAASTTALTNTSTISATSITKGTTLTVTGKATGGTSPYQYSAYYKKASSTEYTKVCGYSTTTKMTIKPAAATTYDIRVKVKDAKGTIATKDFKVTVK